MYRVLKKEKEAAKKKATYNKSTQTGSFSSQTLLTNSHRLFSPPVNNIPLERSHISFAEFDQFRSLVDSYFYEDQAIIVFNKTKIAQERLDEKIDFFIPLLEKEMETPNLRKKDSNENKRYFYFPSVAEGTAYELIYVRQNNKELNFLNDRSHPDPFLTLQFNVRNELVIKNNKICFGEDARKACDLFQLMIAGGAKAQTTSLISQTDHNLYFNERKKLYVCTYVCNYRHEKIEKIAFKAMREPWCECLLKGVENRAGGGFYQQIEGNPFYQTFSHNRDSDQYLLNKEIELEKIDAERLSLLNFTIIKPQRITPLSAEEAELNINSFP